MSGQSNHYDAAVIGAGPAGYTAGIRCAATGMKTIVVDRAEIGGTCLNTGCVPTKILVQAAHDLLRLADLPAEGIETAAASFSLARLMERKTLIVDHLKKGVNFLFKKNKVEFRRASAEFSDAKTLVLDGTEKISADRVIIATGSSPVVPAALSQGFEPGILLTNENVFSLRELPSSLLVLGGGFIGCEFAFVFAALGSKVTIVEQLPEILLSFDGEVVQELKKRLAKAGVEIVTNTAVSSLKKIPAGVEAVLADARVIPVSAALIAAGRKPNSAIPGLAETGVKTEKGYIPVDPATFETNVPGIFAIGDVSGPPLLAHKASDDAERLSESFAGKPRKTPRIIPQVLYTIPEAASVGATEDELIKSGRPYKKTTVPFVPVARARIMGETAGFCKLLTHGDRLLGAHIVGPLASELIPFLSLGLEMSIPVSVLSRHVISHPTVSEVMKDCLAAASGDDT